MDPNALWLLAMSIATPVAGVVGFAIQLRQVRKARLENEKLALEIAALKLAAASHDQRIQRVTTDEVLRFGNDDVRFSRGRGPNPGPDYGAPSSPLGNAAGALVVALVLLIVGYAIYDIYRLVRWVANAL
ncbi:MAG: hypothetical protein DCE87_06910 [Betaproteobacteria bacterium]|jgi:hypothetical protein|nr:MAG: hypothetical protein DCE87_06910 [Betaproteobacteria bacterium]PZO26846.1 MAG: hypothetical protein DCE88_11425 [Betaproteobacteria bacterium]